MHSHSDNVHCKIHELAVSDWVTSLECSLEDMKSNLALLKSALHAGEVHAAQLLIARLQLQSSTFDCACTLTQEALTESALRAIPEE
jgi:hypothetical protein